MTPAERTARSLRTLLARVERDQEAVGAVYGRLRHALDRVESEGADDELISAVALRLHHLYTAIEDLFSRVATDVDGAIPSGPEWHRQLLEQMDLEVSGVRPRLLDDDTLADLDLLRRFRHRIRHAYTDPLDRVEMEPVTEAARRVTESGLPSVVKRLDTSLRAAIDALERE